MISGEITMIEELQKIVDERVAECSNPECDESFLVSGLDCFIDLPHHPEDPSFPHLNKLDQSKMLNQARINLLVWEALSKVPGRLCRMHSILLEKDHKYCEKHKFYPMNLILHNLNILHLSFLTRVPPYQWFVQL